MTKQRQEGKLTIHTTKEQIPTTLHKLIHKSFLKATTTCTSTENNNNNKKCTFHIALSGGSLPSFLTTLPQSFIDAKIDPQWDKWHILLADERCVPSTNQDSNLRSIKSHFLDAVPQIPQHQIYGINEDLLFDHGKNVSENDSIEQVDAIASDYQSRVFQTLDDTQDNNNNENKEKKKEFLIDCALLGFGPDGHTCSLFPNHPLLQENTLLVAGIHNSPKLPPKRITLTLKALNQYTRDVIFVGAGESKSPILKSIFHSVIYSHDDDDDDIKTYNVTMQNDDDVIYPCGMIRPISNSLHYVTDVSATETLTLHKRFTCAML